MAKIISMYSTWSVSNIENDPDAIKLRLRTKDIVNLERTLKENPLSVIANGANMSRDNFQLPSTEKMLTILHASMQTFNHGITFDNVCDMYDTYIENGGTILNLINILMEVFEASGLIPSNDEENVSELTDGVEEEEGEEKNG